MPSNRLKLNCYVDETGQDVRSLDFIVVTVIAATDPDSLRTTLQSIEQESGKRRRKWTDATVTQRLAYVEQVVNTSGFQRSIFYSKFPKPTHYPDSTFQAITQALEAAVGDQPFQAHVFIDGLSMSERQRGTAYLRAFSRDIRKVRGLRDENDEFIRLADIMAGFIRAHFEGADYTERLYIRGIKRGVISEAKG